MAECEQEQKVSSSCITHNVSSTELDINLGGLKSINTTVVFPNDTQHCFTLDKQAKGQILLEAVFQHLQLIEKDYFGLQFTENGQIPYTANPDILKWLNPKKSIKKQMRDGLFYFCVKFYEPDLNKLQEEYTRYYLYLQIRKDILHGKLVIPSNTACLLASYITQYELGDYNNDEHKTNYLSDLIFIPGQTKELEEQISELHKSHKGLSRSEAIFSFLDKSKQLDMYGVYLHKARDSNDKELEIGVMSNGLVVFQNNIRINMLSWDTLLKLSFKKKHFFVKLRRDTPENDTILDFNMISYHSSKLLWKSCVEHHSFFNLRQPIDCLFNIGGIKHFLLGSQFSFSEQTDKQDLEEKQHTFFRFKSKCSSEQSVKNKTDKSNLTISKGSVDDKIKSLDNSSSNNGDGCILTENLDKSMPNNVEDELFSDISDIPAYDTESLFEGDKNVFCIHMIADKRGRFGFNIKGGSDLDSPVIVSRVAPDTVAYRSNPKLCVGDQILMINGQELTPMNEDDVINLIRAARDLEHGQLILTIAPKDIGLSEKEEPFSPNIPEVPIVMTSSDPLSQSILLLENSLISGYLVTQFEQLYRHKPDSPMNIARTTKNKYKNRYRDVLPYDSTRFILKDQENNYINANYINMNIPGSGIINRYIATQGPLQTTSGDFWNMVLESHCSIIVMATALVEKGHQKCFKYWPTINEELKINNNLMIKTVSEEIDTSNIIVYRQIDLTELDSNETRTITQLQYCLWPDHGVPNDSKCLLNLVEAIRKQRTGIVEPIIIHCSAGIGRTGVIILLETALCLVEASQPVFPLEIVQQMRNQRAMMIQTTEQYTFVCNCIHYAFTNGLIKPLPEYLK